MAHRNRRYCPICGKQDLLKLSNHLSQAHQLTSEERRPLLRRAVLSQAPLVPLQSFQDGMSPWCLSLPQPPSSAVVPPSRQSVNCLEPHLYPEFRFKHMFSMMVVGPSQCGKTHFVQRLLTRDCIDFPEKKPRMVCWFYNQWQPSYEVIQRALKKNIRFAQGLPELKDDLSNINPTYNNIIVLDDLMSQAADSPVVSKLFTQGRHRNASVILLLQNMFPKGKYNTDISRNALYKVLFRSPGDRKQIDIMAEQTFAKDRPRFMKAYTQETEKPYGYIVLDNHPRTTSDKQVVADVFDDCKSYPCTSNIQPPPVTDYVLEEPRVQNRTLYNEQHDEPAVKKQSVVKRKGKQISLYEPKVKKQRAVKRNSVKKRSAVKTNESKVKKQSLRAVERNWIVFDAKRAKKRVNRPRFTPEEENFTARLATPSEEDEDEPLEATSPEEDPWDSGRLNQLAAPSDGGSSGGTWHYPRHSLIVRPRPQGGFGPRCSYE